jgi:hypothetical protein
MAGSWGSTCPGEVIPRTELCDAQDDDCDGVVDDPFLPTNPFVSNGADGAFNPTSNVTLAARVYNFTTINIPSGVTVFTNGTGVLELRATGAVTIAGTVDVSGATAAPG